MARKVFISHKNNNESNQVGSILKEKLQGEYDIFLDDDALQGGMNWKQEILDFLIGSDVVIIIVNEETAKSDWVQREIDIAKIRGISLLPITLDGEQVEVQKALKRFDIGDTQYIHLPDSLASIEAIDSIMSRIEPLCNQTIAKQANEIKTWQKQLRDKREKADNDPNAIIFKHPTLDKVKFHIVTGDATQLREYNILVNTENTYMQMARFFEVNTLSWAIRTSGALLASDKVSLKEDTVQDEVYQQIRLSDLPTTPVTERRIIVTGVGHADSKLRSRTDYRYLFHAASVRVNLKGRDVVSIDSPSLIIENCFEEIQHIDNKRGEVLYNRNDDLIPVNDYEPLDSILFPAFGAGDGGKDITETATEIVKCFLDDVPTFIGNTSITKIGFSVFLKSERDIVRKIFEDSGFKDVT